MSDTQTALQGLTKAQLDTSLNVALQDKTVQNLLQQAMGITDEKRMEYGGYIVQKGMGFTVKRWGGEKGSITLHGSKATDKQAADIARDGGIIVADYHCHPGHKVFECVPSQEDIDNAANLTCRRLVITHKHMKAMPKPGAQLHNQQTLPDYFIWDVRTAVS